MEVKIYAVYMENSFQLHASAAILQGKKGEGSRCVASINVEGMIVTLLR
jgi:hypothetical protein